MLFGITFDTWQRALAISGVVSACLAIASLVFQTKASQRFLFSINFLAALIGAATGVLSYFVSKASGDESDLKIAEAMAKSSRAESDAAHARQVTAAIEGENIRLRTRFEEERTARLKIEEQIRPRHLTTAEQDFIIKAISPFAGQSIRLQQQTGDREIEEYAQDFASVFKRAKWKLEGQISTGVSEIHMDVDTGGAVMFLLPAEIKNPSQAVVALQKSLLKIGALTEPNVLAEDPRNELKPGSIQLRIGKKL